MQPGAPSQKIRLGILVSHPIQYFTPVYRELANAHDIDLTVLFRARVGVDEYHDEGFGKAIRWDTPLLEGYPHKFLSRKRTLSGTELTIVQEVRRRRSGPGRGQRYGGCLPVWRRDCTGAGVGHADRFARPAQELGRCSIAVNRRLGRLSVRQGHRHCSSCSGGATVSCQMDVGRDGI